ncbi:MAG: family 10 glycosylhydrolase [Bacilli bacterium]|nr:family 10 glycosylhydrolase [Bacilli bacterium]
MRKILLSLLFLASILLTGCDLLQQYQEQKIYISFDTYGAGQIERIYLEDFTELPIPEKEGYNFVGWFYERTYETEATNENIALITKSISVYAQWEYIGETYTVTFVDYDETVLKDEIVAYNQSATPPTNPTREGYTFTGWNASYEEITENKTIVAEYEVNVYTIRFLDYDGTILKVEHVEYLLNATPPIDPERPNYAFIEWQGTYIQVENDADIMAIYESTDVTITYEVMGGSPVESIVLEYGATIPLPTSTKTGYIFSGWTYLGSPLTMTKAYQDMALVATWAVEADYTLSFDSKGGSLVSPMSVSTLQVINTLPTPTKSGGTFLHWICNGFIVTTPCVYNYGENVTFEAVYTTLYYSNAETVFYRNKTNQVMIPDTYAEREEEFRGVWVSFITNDLSGFQSEEQMKSQLNDILDHLEAWNMNAIVFHVRTHNNAYFNTTRDPQASYMAGVNYGEWDYLTWFIDECHKRGIEFHAWLNPYRISSSTNANTIAANYAAYPDNPASNPDNILVGTSSSILNPGEPAVREYLVDVCMEVIEKYDVDALHFDDYFYISMDSGADIVTYNKYKSLSQTTNISDWRREQVDLFIKALSDEIRANNMATGRDVELGISPSGIWRNGTGSTMLTYDNNGTAVTTGSNTSGMEHYAGYLYSDTKKWVDEEWIDYIIPQTYWSFTQTVAQYAELADWWSKVVKYKNVKLYMGMGIYMESYGWGNNPYEASDQVLYNTKFPEIDGVCIFRYKYIIYRLSANNAGTLRLINDYWQHKVSVPE